MVNSGSFDATGSEGESAKAEFTQLEDGDAAPRSAASPRHLADFAAVVPDSSGSGGIPPERDDGLNTPPKAMTTLNSNCDPPATPTKTTIQCSVPLDKVKNVLELCKQSESPEKSKLSNYFILENLLKHKQNLNSNELTISSDSISPTSTETSSSESSILKPALKRLLCLFCERTFTSNNLRQKHVDRCHSAGQTRRSSSRTSNHNASATACCFCSKLNQTEHTLKELLEHLINEHSNRYYACFPCQERYNTVQLLRDHNKIVHGIEDTATPEIKPISSVLTSETLIREKDMLEKDNSPNIETKKIDDKIELNSPTNSSPTSSSVKPLKRNSSLKNITSSDAKQLQQQENAEKSVGFHVDFEDSIIASVISPEEVNKTKSTENKAVDSVTTRKSRSSSVNSKNKSIVKKTNNSFATTTTTTTTTTNKKISVKSTKNGVRNNLRTTRASVKQVNSNYSKNRKTKIVKSDSETNKQTETQKKPLCNPASVFSLVNAYIYKYEKIYDHASDSIKDANSVQFNAVFDREFYTRTVCNIRENLLNHLDGKLNRNIESETRISHFEHNPALTEIKSTSDASDNFGCDLSLNAVTPVATLLASSQYGEDFDAQIEYGAKASQKKPKKVAVVKYKFPNKKYNSLFRERDTHNDLTCLDMWTQLTVKTRQNKCHDDGSFDSDSPFFERPFGFQAKHQVDELNSILDKRGPFEDLVMEANAAQFLELRKKSIKDGDYLSEEASKDVYFILEEILNRVVNETSVKLESTNEETPENINEPEEITEEKLEIPHYFQLQRSPNKNEIKIDRTDSIAMICSSKDINDKSDKRLELTGEWTRPRLYICAACGLKLPNLKSLDDHKNIDHPHIWCSHYEFVGNQSQIYRHLSIPGLGKVGVIETLPQNRLWQRSDARVCSKCTKQCHNLGELHKHILECGGDWTWMLARKKCKYRPYGARTRRRRQRGYKRTCNPDVPRAPREHKPKQNFIGPRPKPSKPSDAETIERMLANLPPKRNRKMISMRDGIQRPRKPYKQSPNASNSHLNISSKPPNKNIHFKNNAPQIKQNLRSALKRKLAMNNLRKQKVNENTSESVSLKLRSRINKNSNELNNIKTKENDLNQQIINNKTKIRNKRMISRILGSKIFDTNSAIVTRRRLVKAITQNNIIRKTRLRSKMLESNALKSEQSENKKVEETVVEADNSEKSSVKNKTTQDSPKDSKRSQKTQNTVEENSTKLTKIDKSNETINIPDKTLKKSNSKRILSVLTKSNKKTRTSPDDKIKSLIENKPDTISAIIEEVVNMSVNKDNISEKTEIQEKKSDNKLRRTRSLTKIDIPKSTKNEVINKTNEESNDNKSETLTENKSDTKEIKKTDKLGKVLGKKTNKLMQNVKAFRKSIKQSNTKKTVEKNEGIASKLMRTFSMRGSKRKKINKSDDKDTSAATSSENITEITSEIEFKKTTSDQINTLNENKTETRIINAEIIQPAEIEMPTLEKIDPLPTNDLVSDTANIVLPVLCPVTQEPTSLEVKSILDEVQTSELELQKDDKIDSAAIENNSIELKQCDDKLHSANTLNKFKSKIKRSGRGLNDCIAMLKCKLEQKIQSNDPPLVDKSNLFILNSLEVKKHSLVESSFSNPVESTKLITLTTDDTLKKVEIINDNLDTSLDISIEQNNKVINPIDLSVHSKTESTLVKSVLEVPSIKNRKLKTDSTPEVSTVEIETQTVDEDIAPNAPTEYLPNIQANIQLSSLLNATLKNCLMECVKNKCEELKIENKNIEIKTKSASKDRKIGSVRKRRTTKPKVNDITVEKHVSNIPIILNTAFIEKNTPKSKTGLIKPVRTTTAEDTSEDDLPLSKLVSSSSSDKKLKVKLSVAKKTRSVKKKIAFTPLILNSPDTCIPQISFQERLEQRIEAIQGNVISSKNKHNIASTSINESNKFEEELIKDSSKNIKENISKNDEKTNLISTSSNFEEKTLQIQDTVQEKSNSADETIQIQDSMQEKTNSTEQTLQIKTSEQEKSSYTKETLQIKDLIQEKSIESSLMEPNSILLSSNQDDTKIEHKDKNKGDIQETEISVTIEINDNLPLSQQIMTLEDEPCDNYLINKTLTEANVESPPQIKNTLQHLPSVENMEHNKTECVDSGKENSDYQSVRKQKRTMKKTRGKRKSRTKANPTDPQIDTADTSVLLSNENNIEKLPSEVQNESTTTADENLLQNSSKSDENDSKNEKQNIELSKNDDTQIENETSELNDKNMVKKRRSLAKNKITPEEMLIIKVDQSTQNEESTEQTLVTSVKKRRSRKKINDEMSEEIHSDFPLNIEEISVVPQESVINENDSQNSQTALSELNITNNEMMESNIEEENEELNPQDTRRKRTSRVKTKLNHEEIEKTSDLESSNSDTNIIKETPETVLNETPVQAPIKKKRGRKKKDPSLTPTEKISENVETVQAKRITRTKLKINYQEIEHEFDDKSESADSLQETLTAFQDIKQTNTPVHPNVSESKNRNEEVKINNQKNEILNENISLNTNLDSKIVQSSILNTKNVVDIIDEEKPLNSDVETKLDKIDNEFLSNSKDTIEDISKNKLAETFENKKIDTELLTESNVEQTTKVDSTFIKNSIVNLNNKKKRKSRSKTINTDKVESDILSVDQLKETESLNNSSDNSVTGKVKRSCTKTSINYQETESIESGLSSNLQSGFTEEFDKISILSEDTITGNKNEQRSLIKTADNSETDNLSPEILSTNSKSNIILQESKPNSDVSSSKSNLYLSINPLELLDSVNIEDIATNSLPTEEFSKKKRKSRKKTMNLQENSVSSEPVEDIDTSITTDEFSDSSVSIDKKKKIKSHTEHSKLNSIINNEKTESLSENKKKQRSRAKTVNTEKNNLESSCSDFPQESEMSSVSTEEIETNSVTTDTLPINSVLTDQLETNPVSTEEYVKKKRKSRKKKLTNLDIEILSSSAQESDTNSTSNEENSEILVGNKKKQKSRLKPSNTNQKLNISSSNLESNDDLSDKNPISSEDYAKSLVKEKKHRRSRMKKINYQEFDNFESEISSLESDSSSPQDLKINSLPKSENIEQNKNRFSFSSDETTESEINKVNQIESDSISSLVSNSDKELNNFKNEILPLISEEKIPEKLKKANNIEINKQDISNMETTNSEPLSNNSLSELIPINSESDVNTIQNSKINFEVNSLITELTDVIKTRRSRKKSNVIIKESDTSEALPINTENLSNNEQNLNTNLDINETSETDNKKRRKSRKKTHVIESLISNLESITNKSQNLENSFDTNNTTFETADNKMNQKSCKKPIINDIQPKIAIITDTFNEKQSLENNSAINNLLNEIPEENKAQNFRSKIMDNYEELLISESDLLLSKLEPNSDKNDESEISVDSKKKQKHRSKTIFNIQEQNNIDYELFSDTEINTDKKLEIDQKQIENNLETEKLKVINEDFMFSNLEQIFDKEKDLVTNKKKRRSHKKNQLIHNTESEIPSGSESNTDKDLETEIGLNKRRGARSAVVIETKINSTLCDEIVNNTEGENKKVTPMKLKINYNDVSKISADSKLLSTEIDEIDNCKKKRRSRLKLKENDKQDEISANFEIKDQNTKTTAEIVNTFSKTNLEDKKEKYSFNSKTDLPLTYDQDTPLITRIRIKVNNKLNEARCYPEFIYDKTETPMTINELNNEPEVTKKRRKSRSKTLDTETEQTSNTDSNMNQEQILEKLSLEIDKTLLEIDNDKKKRRPRTKHKTESIEQEIQNLNIEPENTLENNPNIETENKSSDLDENVQDIPKLEFTKNMQLFSNVDTNKSNSVQVTENELSIINEKPQPKKRGRKPRKSIVDNKEILSINSAEISNKKFNDSGTEIQPENENELSANLENERKSRRSRPKINYQEFDNDDSNELSNTELDNEINLEPILNEKESENEVIEEIANLLKESNSTSNNLSGSTDKINSSPLILNSNKVSEVPIISKEESPILEKQKKRRGRKKSSALRTENIDIPLNSDEYQKTEKQDKISEYSEVEPDSELNETAPNIFENNFSDVQETNNKRRSRSKINYQEIESLNSLEFSSNSDAEKTEETVFSITNKESISNEHNENLPMKLSLNLEQNIENEEKDIISNEEILTNTIIKMHKEPKKKRSRSKSNLEHQNLTSISENELVQESVEEKISITENEKKKRRGRKKKETKPENSTNELASNSDINLELFEQPNITTSEINEESVIPTEKEKKKRKSRSKSNDTISQQNIASALELLTNVENTIESLKELTKEKPLNNFKTHLQKNIEYEPDNVVMEHKNIQELTPIENLPVEILPPVIGSDSEDEIPLILLKSKTDSSEIEPLVIDSKEVISNDASVISENNLLNEIDVDDLIKVEKKLILSTHNSFDFEDDNIIDQEELSQLVDITNENLLENIEDDEHIGTINSAESKNIPDLDIPNEEKVLDEIIDLKIITKDFKNTEKPLHDNEFLQESEEIDNINNDEKIDDIQINSAENILTYVETPKKQPPESNSEFITTPDLKDTSLIIKIKKNLNVNIRKHKKTRRRVIPKSLNKSYIRRKEEDETATFICEICNKIFKRKENLASHKRTLTHIAKLSEIEARENLAKRMNEVELENEENLTENKNEEEDQSNITNITEEIKFESEEIKLESEEIKLESKETKKEIINENKEIEDIKNTEEMIEIFDEDECSIECVQIENKTENLVQNVASNDTEIPVEEILDIPPQKTVANMLPGFVNSNNSTLKLIDIINEVLDKPVTNLNIADSSYSPQSIRKSPNSCDSSETFSEPKRYKSLGERKSFDSDTYNIPSKSNEETTTENFNSTLKPISNGEILCKQLSILENIIDETNPSLNNYIDDSVSISSSHFEEPLPEQNISQKELFKTNDFTKYSHTAEVLSNLIKPNHFNNFHNISESFVKPTKHQEENTEEEIETRKKTAKDNSTRKILNRDEELFLECCSLLKSGSEITGSKKSTKQIQLNNFSRSNDASWIIQKQQNSDRFIQRDSYSWLAQSSRVETPIGEPFVNNDWSNSNSAVSSEWLAQKAPSPDRPTESNTIMKKSNNNSGESKYTDIQFEDISIESSLETSKTLMATEHLNNENIPIDFHHVDFSSNNLQCHKEDNVIDEISEVETKSKEQNEENENLIMKQSENEKCIQNDEFDAELKKKVVSAFGGLMAKALSNRLHAVVRKSKKSKNKRDITSTIQASITDYAVPAKKNKPNQTDSDSSDCPKKLITKGAMKIFEGLKVSIPTQDLNLQEVLNCSTKIKKMDNDQTTIVSEEKGPITNKKQILLEDEVDNKNGKIKSLFGRFGNKLGLREKKKKTNKRRSPKMKVNSDIKNVPDVYDFEESLDSNLVKNNAFTVFKTIKENSDENSKISTSKDAQDNSSVPGNEIDTEKWNADSESDTDRYYDSMSFEELSLSSESTPECNTPVKIKPAVKRNTEKTKENQKKCMIMGRIFKNASKPKLEDKIPEIRDFSSEENSKIVENYLDSCSSVENVENEIVEHPPELQPVPNNVAVVNSVNKMSKKEMDMLFDKLLEEEMKMAKKAETSFENETNVKKSISEDVFSKPLSVEKLHSEKKKCKDNKLKVPPKSKKRQRHNSDSESSDEFKLGGRQSKSTKKHNKPHRKPNKPKKDSGINLEQEMKECIGVAGRKSQRKCTSGKQNVLVEFWSSDESSFEEVLNLIEKQKENKINQKETIPNREEISSNEHIEELNNSDVSNSLNISTENEEQKKPSIDIYDFESDAESRIEDFHSKTKAEEALTKPQEISEFLSVNKIKIPKRIPKPKRNRKHSRNHDDESASEYEIEKTRRRNEHKRKKMLENNVDGDETGESVDCLAVSRKKRNAGDQLYYWSSSSDDEMQDLIEVKPIREDTDDDRPMHHGWIVGDSPKKLVTMLAQAKGKKIDGESVKEQGKKNRVTL